MQHISGVEKSRESADESTPTWDFLGAYRCQGRSCGQGWEAWLCVTCLKTSLEKYINIDQLTNRQNICWAGKFFAAIFNNYFYLRFTLTKFEMQDPALNRNGNGSLYREPFYFDIFYLRYMLNLRYLLNSISTLTFTFVSEKKVLPR